VITRLVVENLKHRPVRTALSVTGIGVSVAMVLTLIGVSEGMLRESVREKRGTGADIMIRPPGSALIGFSGDMKAGVVDVVRGYPEVALATGTLVVPIGSVNSVTGVNWEEFGRLSGGFRFKEGGPFQNPNDVIIDEVWSRSYKLRAGDTYKGLLNRDWHVCGVVESGKLARVFLPLAQLQELASRSNQVTVVYVKLKDPSKADEMVKLLHERLDGGAAEGAGYKIYSMEEFASLLSVDNIPMLRTFIDVVIGLGIVFGAVTVSLAMYTAVLERTREIGILKALGASPAYILRLLLAETALLGVIGAVVGIGFTYGTRSLMNAFVPSMVTVIVPELWPIAICSAVAGALIGAIYPGFKAAKQDAIEAIAYD
jgi:putative ABC transport system permease protein